MDFFFFSLAAGGRNVCLKFSEEKYKDKPSVYIFHNGGLTVAATPSPVAL